MTRPQSEQLQSLNNFQRAEFLRLQRSQFAYSGKIIALRAKTAALYEKQQADRAKFEKIATVFWILVVVLTLLQNIFDLLSAVEQLGGVLLIFIIPIFSLLAMKIHVNHDDMLFESYMLEIMSYESELETNGLLVYYGLEDDLTRDILKSLGFHDGRIGGVLNAWPLDAAE